MITVHVHVLPPDYIITTNDNLNHLVWFLDFANHLNSFYLSVCLSIHPAIQFIGMEGWRGQRSPFVTDYSRHCITIHQNYGKLKIEYNSCIWDIVSNTPSHYKYQREIEFNSCIWDIVSNTPYLCWLGVSLAWSYTQRPHTRRGIRQPGCSVKCLLNSCLVFMLENLFGDTFLKHSHIDFFLLMTFE